MTRAQIIQAVKVRLEELTPFSEGLVVLSPSDEVKPVTSYIDSLLNESADEIKMLLPLHMLTPVTLNAPVTVNDGVGTIELPADFLRIHSIKAPAWERDVTQAISPENPMYALQRNRFTRGKSAKPVVAINRTSTKKVLELYSVSSTDMEKKLYIPQTPAEALSDKLIPYLVLMCAIKVSNVLERADVVKSLSAELSDMIKIQQL
jgi:hypothetical protein